MWGAFADSRRCRICDVPPGAWHLDWCDRSGEWDGEWDGDDDGDDDDEDRHS
jgi:hypothetical protein